MEPWLQTEYHRHALNKHSQDQLGGFRAFGVFAIVSNDSKGTHKLAIHFWNTTCSILITHLPASCRADIAFLLAGLLNLSLSSSSLWLAFKMGKSFKYHLNTIDPLVYQRILSCKVENHRGISTNSRLAASRVSHTPRQCGKHDRNSFGISCIQPHLCLPGKSRICLYNPTYACTTQPNCATKWNPCNPEKLCGPSDEESHHDIPRLMFFQQWLDSCPKHFHRVEMSRGTYSIL